MSTPITLEKQGVGLSAFTRARTECFSGGQEGKSNGPLGAEPELLSHEIPRSEAE